MSPEKLESPGSPDFAPSTRYPHRLGSFRDAAGFALELSAEHHGAEAAVVVDCRGQVIDVCLETGQDAGAGLGVLAWADGRARAEPATAAGRSLIVITVDRARPVAVSGADRALYRWVAQSFSRCNVTLVDWLRTDGEGFQSTAYALHPRTAWPGDDAPIRVADHAMLCPPPTDDNG